MTTYSYSRSSKSITTPRDSHETQAEAIEGFCRSMKWELGRNWAERAVSGDLSLDLRPVGKQMLSRLKDGDRVVVSSLDRLFRSPMDARNQLTKLKKKGVEIWLAKLGLEITEGRNFDLVMELVQAFAATEAALLGNRIREMKARLRDEGKFQGGKVEFGFKLNSDGTLSEEPDAQEALKLMHTLRKEGQSYRAISEAIQKKYRGKLSISHEGIRRILTRKD
jgi:DNA invertase Pin-like site-specific DNA recombinase